jgi:mRNA-degrading endonuclease RelE of RelBE toxin-antitoxin system
MLEIRYSNQAVRFLKNTEKSFAKRILNKMENLRANPFPHNSKRIENTNYFRIRIGNCRVLYEVNYTINTIGVVKIDKRSRVYHD